MHHCEEFRERITEHIIDREDLTKNADFQQELLICPACSDFYAESREMIEALSAVDLSISERQWDGLEHRLRMRLVKTLAPPLRQQHTKSLTFAPVIAAAAMLLITFGLYRLATPLVSMEALRAPAPRPVYVDHSVPLDPVTVDFLEESELLLRNMMKITVNDTDDLAETMRVANGQLADIEQRKDAAADVPPVVDMIDTYETILRDIRNLDGRNAAEDIADIQSRIRKNGLIANIKAFQPSVTPASFDVR
jgi:hypothetical protein